MDSMAYHAVTENGSAASELRTNAHDCIGSGPWTHRIQGCGAIDPRSNAGSPLIVILLTQPTAFDGAAVLLVGDEEYRTKKLTKEER